MSQLFSSVPLTKISRSRHNLSHQVKASFDPGKLTPLMCELARPGDSWKSSLEQFVRTMPMMAPVMDMVDIKVDAFFVPIRLLWDDFEDFITLGLTGEFEATRPTISLSSVTSPDSIAVARINDMFGVGGLADYLNFPTNQAFTVGTNTTAIQHDALPYRAYQFIYNEYYMNENLESPINIDTSSGDLSIGIASPAGNVDSWTNFCLKNRGWRKDYFTSALPYPQKGPAVRIPHPDLVVGTKYEKDEHDLMNPVPLKVGSLGYYDMDENITNAQLNMDPFADPFSHPSSANLAYVDTDEELKNLYYEKGLDVYPSNYNPDDPTTWNVYPTIEELRYAEVLQEFYEANARGGTRPKEYYQNIWHTRSKDARLDRPEYLGGYRGPITISDIDQTSQSATTAQGTLAGKGVSAGGQKLFRYHVPEWGIIMVIMSVQPKTAYYQGFRRWNLYQDVFDWPNPFFANLGEQEIYNKELYYDPSDNKDDNTFGYTPRYSECKYIPDTVHGQFRSSLDYWHLARKFGSRPNLNSAFVHVQPSEMARIFPSQVSSNDKLVGTFFFHISCKMYLPYWGVPRLLHSI